MVTTAQLRAAGIEGSAITYRIQVGRLHPVFDGVYSLGGPPQTDKELWMAATLTFGAGAKLAASAAAELYGWLRYPLNEIHVLTPTPRKGRDGIRTRYTSRPVRWKFIDFIPVTGAEQTVLDCATTVRSDKAYRRIVRQSQIDDTTHAALLSFAAINKGARGVARLKYELAEGPSPTRSANEDDILEVFRRGGEPEPNKTIFGVEVDLYFARLGVAVEVMSSLHDNPTAYADDVAKKAYLEGKGVRVLWIT
jgi:hypothetical protein